MDIAELTHLTEEIGHVRAKLVAAKQQAAMMRRILAVEKAAAETRILVHATENGTLPSNEAARARYLTLCLEAESGNYRSALRDAITADDEVLELEADLETLRDRRRLVEWALRMAIIDRAGAPGLTVVLAGEGI